MNTGKECTEKGRRMGTGMERLGVEEPENKTRGR